MSGESYHHVRDSLETQFVVWLGIYTLDETNQVAISDSSSLPRADGEGGTARVIREQESNRSRTVMSALVNLVTPLVNSEHVATRWGPESAGCRGNSPVARPTLQVDCA